MWGITTLDFFFLSFLSRDKQENVNASVKGFGFALSFQDYAPMDALRARVHELNHDFLLSKSRDFEGDIGSR